MFEGISLKYVKGCNVGLHVYLWVIMIIIMSDYEFMVLSFPHFEAKLCFRSKLGGQQLVSVGWSSWICLPINKYTTSMFLVLMCEWMAKCNPSSSLAPQACALKVPWIAGRAERAFQHREVHSSLQDMMMFYH